MAVEPALSVLDTGSSEGSSFARLPDDVLTYVFSFLPPYSLRSAAATNRWWLRVLWLAPKPVRRRASWRHRWTAAGAGASIQNDPAVCTGGGTWHPGGVALASSLLLSTHTDVRFRLVIETAAPGDLLMGITQRLPDDALAGSVGDLDLWSPLEMGYHYIMGRTSEAAGVGDEVRSSDIRRILVCQKIRVCWKARAAQLNARGCCPFSALLALLWDQYFTAGAHGGAVTQTQTTPRVDRQSTMASMVVHQGI